MAEEGYGMRLGLAVESMKRHMTDEGWQLFAGLGQAGYTLCGYNLPVPETDVYKLLVRYDPDVVVVQDKREWEPTARDFREQKARFTNTPALRLHRCFKVTVLKDAHQRPEFHSAAAKEMGIDLHIIYYHEDAVRRAAKWLTGPVVRTYHSLDVGKVPEFERRTGKALLSGAISSAYPLRERLAKYIPEGVAVLPHPGYHMKGCYTPSYLRTLSQYRVAICTCSKYQYALRKIMEATACGCVVVTDLPPEDELPHIDGNLVRVSPNISGREVTDLVKRLCNEYDCEKQKHFATLALQHYDYRVLGRKLAEDIEHARASAIRRS